MRRRLIIALPIALLLCWWLFPLDGEDGSPRRRGDRRTAESENRREPGAAIAPDASPGWSSGGTVLDAGGAPVGGASISLRPLARHALGGVGDADVAVVRSDGEGRFAFPPTIPRGALLLVARADGCVPAWKPIEVDDAGSDAVTLHLGKPTGLAGLVVDPDDRPVPGARVLVWGHDEIFPFQPVRPGYLAVSLRSFRSVWTDEQGRFRVDDLPPGGKLRVVAVTRDSLSSWGFERPVERGDTNVRVSVAPLAVAWFRAVGPDGDALDHDPEAVSCSWLDYTWENYEERVEWIAPGDRRLTLRPLAIPDEIRAAGRDAVTYFRGPRTAGGAPFRIKVSRTGFETTTAELRIRSLSAHPLVPDTLELRPVVPGFGRLRIRYPDAKAARLVGEPGFPEVALQLDPKDGGDRVLVPLWRSKKPDALFHLVPAGEYRVRAECDAFELEVEPEEVLISGSATPTIRLHPPDLTRLRIEVRSASESVLARVAAGALILTHAGSGRRIQVGVDGVLAHDLVVSAGRYLLAARVRTADGNYFYYDVEPAAVDVHAPATTVWVRINLPSGD